MLGFRLSAQVPPAARRIKHDVIMRFDHVYEVDPALMEIYPQQHIPAWDTHRIVDSRWDHLAWMHQHFADRVVSAAELGLPAELLGDDADEHGAGPGH
ncbi:hypothetical protein [Egicoccus sp. AB-alg2]|uniref:hypothetical protein n=1 Tax=Egicoccus sp. AB-alg2 TaxID=3242693 RepID=UPI00359E77F1